MLNLNGEEPQIQYKLRCLDLHNNEHPNRKQAITYFKPAAASPRWTNLETWQKILVLEQKSWIRQQKESF